MNFTFKKHLYQLLLGDIILNFIILISIFCLKFSFISVFFVLTSLYICNKDIIKQMYNIKKFVKENTVERINKLENDLSDNYLIYDDWYLTDEYMFSVRILKEISYKDIIVVEDGFTLVSGGRGKTLGNKQTIY